MHPEKIYWREAPKSMLSNYFCPKIVLRSTFWKIRRIQLQKYPQTHSEPKYGAYYMNNKVRVHGLVLLVQLNWRAASPFQKKCHGFPKPSLLSHRNQQVTSPSLEVRWSSLKFSTTKWTLQATLSGHTNLVVHAFTYMSAVLSPNVPRMTSLKSS